MTYHSITTGAIISSHSDSAKCTELISMKPRLLQNHLSQSTHEGDAMEITISPEELANDKMSPKHLDQAVDAIRNDGNGTV